jgi:uncharacterized protein YodC (DUF2158 family)
MNAGDVVELKSGGPKMTVTGLAGHNYTIVGVARVVPAGFALCLWFDKSELKQDRFPLESLKPSGEVPAAVPVVPDPEAEPGPGDMMRAYNAGKQYAHDQKQHKGTPNPYPEGSKLHGEFHRGWRDSVGY